jgi:hypothetical protein
LAVPATAIDPDASPEDEAVSAAEAMAPIQLQRGGCRVKWPSDPYVLRAAAIRGAAMQLEVSYTGGCQQHRFDLLARDPIATVDGLRVELQLAHDGHGDNCKALIRQQLQFSLQPFLAAYRDELAKSSGRVEFRLGGHRIPWFVP